LRLAAASGSRLPEAWSERPLHRTIPSPEPRQAHCTWQRLCNAAILCCVLTG